MEISKQTSDYLSWSKQRIFNLFLNFSPALHSITSPLCFEYMHASKIFQNKYEKNIKNNQIQNSLHTFYEYWCFLEEVLGLEGHTSFITYSILKSRYWYVSKLILHMKNITDI